MMCSEVFTRLTEASQYLKVFPCFGIFCSIKAVDYKIYLCKKTPRMDDVACTNGQKFVLKKAKGVRKQFMVVDGKKTLAFITKGKKFTECSTFLDITSKVKFKRILQWK